MLVRRDDLLRHHVQRPLVVARGGAARVLDAASLQALEVARRIEQPVGMVDAQAVHPLRVEQLEDQAVRRLEDLRLLHAQRRQLVDVEEVPVVDLVAGNAPVGEPVGLRADDGIERIDAGAIVRAAVQQRERGVDRVAERGVPLHQLRQRLRMDGLVALALAARRGIGGIARRQMAQRCSQARQRVAHGGRQRIGPGLRQHALEHHGIGGRIERQRVFVVAQHEAARLVRQLQLAAFQHHAIVVAEDRHQHAAGEIGVGRLPVDVEVAGERRCAAVLQHVHPPRVVGAQHAHVIGHHVHQQAHAVRVQRGHQLLELLARTDFGVERVVVDHVVAMAAAGTCTQEGRAVQVAHAERGQVGHHGTCRCKAELAMQLQPVGGPRQHAAPRLRQPLIHSTARA